MFILAPGYPDYNNPFGKIYIYSCKKLTDVKDYNSNSPNNINLYQNYPNLFNPNTTISYQLPSAGIVSLKVYDMVGREVAVLVDEVKEAGYYNATFNGSGLASGIYFVRFNATPSATQTADRQNGAKPFGRTIKILLTK